MTDRGTKVPTQPLLIAFRDPRNARLTSSCRTYSGDLLFILNILLDCLLIIEYFLGERKNYNKTIVTIFTRGGGRGEQERVKEVVQSKVSCMFHKHVIKLQ